MDDPVKSSDQYWYRDEFESFVGDSDSVDFAECESEKVVRVWVVDLSFQSNLHTSHRRLEDPDPGRVHGVRCEVQDREVVH